MRIPFTSRVYGLLVFATCIALTPMARAQDTPDPKAIIANSIKAMGGAEAYAKVNSRLMKGRMEIVGMGVSGSMEMMQLRPGKSLTKSDIEGIGTILQGVDGDVVWESNPMTGARIIDGEERTMLLFANRFDETNFEELIKSYEYAGEADVNGTACHKIIVTVDGMKPITTYYAKDTGLTAKTEMTITTQMGEVVSETTTGDYRKVGEISYPFSAVQKAMGMEIKITFDSIEHNVEFPEDAFAMPEDVKAIFSDAGKSGTP